VRRKEQISDLFTIKEPTLFLLLALVLYKILSVLSIRRSREYQYSIGWFLYILEMESKLSEYMNHELKKVLHVKNSNFLLE
jgi:hypothetical protein